MKYSEVHLHLEGAVFDAAIEKINKRRNIPKYNSSTLSTKDSFFKKMNYVSREILTCKQDYIDAFENLCSFLSPTHGYVEITISPRAFDYYHNGDFEEILGELSNKAMQEKDLRINFLIDLLRNSGRDQCWSYLEMAKRCSDSLPNVVGISLAGDEIKYPTNQFIPHIAKAKEYGLNVTVHAGEWGGADSVWDALDAGADRIGHGIRSVDDKSLLDKLSIEGIPLEICPTSNLCTGASEDLNELVILADAGVNLIINTDDPAIFKTTLKDELAIFRNLHQNYKFGKPFLFDGKVDS